MAWIWDAPAGVYKNHALSKDIRMQAAADALFAQFVRPESGYGKKKGESITITRVMQLPLAGRVSEIDRLPTGRPAIDTKAVTVDEWGFKIELTEFEENLSHFNIRNPFQGMLRDQMALTMDKMLADAAKLTPYLYIPTLTGGVFDTDGTPSTTANANLGIADLRKIRDELRGTLKAPFFRNGRYVGILSTNAARGIKNDPEYKDWIAPTSSKPMRAGQLEDVEQFALFETNHFDALANAVGTGGILGEAVFFGADAMFLASVATPELRAGIPTDLGRFRETGWVGVMEAGLVWDTAATARLIYVTSQ